MSKIKTICKLISDFMNLDKNHCYIFNQKWFIPKDKGLCIVVGINNNNILASNSYHKEIDGVYSEVLEVQIQEQISIDIFSYNTDAITRKEEILMALNSDIAQNTQVQEGFHIGKIPIGFIDASEQDGDKILNRFNISINVISSNTKVIKSDYFDTGKFKIIKNN